MKVLRVSGGVKVFGDKSGKLTALPIPYTGKPKFVAKQKRNSASNSSSRDSAAQYGYDSGGTTL